MIQDRPTVVHYVGTFVIETLVTTNIVDVF
jgi:hypothetical protein